MKEIKQIVKDIKGELKGAEHYAELAMKYKDTRPTLAAMYWKLGSTELEHVNALHEQAATLIKEQKASGTAIPPAMQAIWDYEHEGMVADTAAVKTMLSMFKGS